MGPSTPDVQGLARAFAALGDPVRISILERLRDGPVPSGQLAESIGVSRPTMSKHLKVLRDAGMVLSEPGGDARIRTYAVQQGSLDGARAWLDRVQDFWAGQLEGLAAHVEGLGDPDAR